MEIKELSAQLYRRAGQELAREQGLTTAVIVHAGTLAEAGRRRENGLSTTDTVGEAVLEVCCGDVLATRAAREVDALAAARLERWFHANWELVDRHVDRLYTVQQLFDAETGLPQTERCHVTSAMEFTNIARDSTAADLAYAGAVALSRVRLGDRWYGTSADYRDAYLTETICGDPVWATAAEELDEDKRGKVRGWVYGRWEQITEEATAIETVAGVITAESTYEQKIECTRREVRMRLREVDLPTEQVAYAAAAAEGLARWLDRGGDDARADAIMHSWALGDPTVAGKLERVSAESLAQLRRLVREQWATVSQE
jgi:hypothetical protein